MVGANIQLIEEALGRYSSTDMKLIDRSKVLNTHVARGLA
jgi:hypothetical protein